MSLQWSLLLQYHFQVVVGLLPVQYPVIATSIFPLNTTRSKILLSDVNTIAFPFFTNPNSYPTTSSPKPIHMDHHLNLLCPMLMLYSLFLNHININYLFHYISLKTIMYHLFSSVNTYQVSNYSQLKY
eukprot:293444_1